MTILVVLLWAIFVHRRCGNATPQTMQLLIRKSERGPKAVEAREKIQALILELDSLLKHKGIDFMLVVLPARQDIERDTYNDLSNMQAVIDFSREKGILTIEVKPYLMEKLTSGEVALDELFWRRDYHFTPPGYRYFGEAVQQAFCAQELSLTVPACPTSNTKSAPEL